jgi:iron complex outermembrane receptor protein
MIERDYKPFALLNVKLQWKIEKMKIFLDISNLTGKKYFDLGNLTQPGRWIKSGIILNL